MPYVVGILVLIWAVWMPLNFWFRKKNNKRMALVFKAAGTLSATAVAAYACFFQPQTGNYAMLVLTGLCVCACADVLLDIRFKVGGTLFFIGHVLYVAAFASYDYFTVWSLVVFVAAILLLNWFLSLYQKEIPPDIYSPLVLYTVALSGLLSSSLPLPLAAFSRRTVLGALGALFFVVSDLLLCRNSVGKRSARARVFSLGTYYLAQLMLAASTLSV